jgi:putative adenylate-forming enzyme
MTTVASSYLRTKWLMRFSRRGLKQHRGELWRRFASVMATTPALRDYVGAPLDALPIITPADIRADYGRWNSLGLSHDELHAAALDNEAGGTGEVLPGVTCGYSTGTSGQRGLFVASQRERADYIGQSLARLLPLRALLSRQRIALVLRAGNDLYADVSKSSPISFAHFALTVADDALMARLMTFRPSILIAPAHKLVVLARGVSRDQFNVPTLKHCFYGSEAMGAREAAAVSRALGVRPYPIYQATEGFLAGACQFGSLHLNDHSLLIEKHPIAGTNSWQPVVTDLRRTSQPIVRVALDDVLEDMDNGPCACGFVGRTIAPVMGRVSDIWRFGDLALTPSQITQAMESCVSPLDDWHVTASPNCVTISLPADWTSAQKDHVAAAFSSKLSIPVPVKTSAEPPPLPRPKRQRIVWQERQSDG